MNTEYSAKDQQGLTLLELLMVIVVLAILVALAVPSMEGVTRSQGIRALQKELSTTFTYARAEAIARNKTISVCPSADGGTCDTGTNNWSNGWVVFVDNGAGVGGVVANGVLDGTEEPLRSYSYDGQNLVGATDATDATEMLNSLSWNYQGFTRYNPGGGAAPSAIAAAFVVCPPGNENQSARAVLVEFSGRSTGSRDDDGNGIHEARFADPDDNTGSVSREISCT